MRNTTILNSTVYNNLETSSAIKMGEVWNANSCLLRQWSDSGQNLTESESQCPPIWDGFSCWGPTQAGSIASSKCPSFKGSDITKSAFRICSSNGEWLDKDGIPGTIGWTNYTPCLTPEIREIMRRLGSNVDAQTKFNIAANTRILEFVGLTLSLAALLLSLFIFCYFRMLRNSRTRLHRHLFIAMVIQVTVRLIVYTDQAITRPTTEASIWNADVTDTWENSSTGSTGVYGDGQKATNHLRGIDNTPILCEASYIALEYARTAMFMWMFVEGLFLHNMITVTVFEEKLSPLVYPIIGWVLPIPLTATWAVVTHLHYGSATCWWGYNFTAYFWILEGPRLAVLVVNLVFLLNILRVLVTKLRQSSSSEIQQAMKAVKAALFLLPLLGITNLVNMVDAPLEKSPFQFALWSYTTHFLTSTQGFILAFLYCFRNGEVQVAIRKFVRIRVLGNSRHTIITKKSIPISALDNGSFYPDDVAEYAGVSYSQTVNIINPSPVQNPNDGITYISEKNVCANNNNNNTYLSNNTEKSQNKNMPKKTKIMSKPAAYSSPSVGEVSNPRPLMIRSYSIGILKGNEFQQQASQQRHDLLKYHRHHPLNSLNVPENRQILHHQRNLSYSENEHDCI